MIKRIMVLLAVLALSLLPAGGAQADDRSFSIESAEIHAYLDANGDMRVTEVDTYRFDGAFNGILVDLDSTGSDGIQDFKAVALSPQGERPLRVEQTTKKNQISYKVFDASKDEQKQFRLTYQVRNVVQVYQDTAELYWQFFGKSNTSQIESVNIFVHLPPGVKRDELLAFGHGSLVGNLTVLDGGVVQYTVQPLRGGEMLETRLLFPPTYVPGSTKIKHEAALEKIKAEELRWADEADRRFAMKIDSYRKLLYMGAGVLGFNLLVVFLLYRRFGKPHRPDWEGQYCRDLPAEITPAVMSYLVSYGVQARDLMATLMDLVRRHYVEMRVVETEGGLFHRKRADYRFRLINEDRQHLLAHEQNLIDWFFRDLAQEGELSLEALQEAAKKKATAGEFVSRFDAWRLQATADAQAHPWFEANAGKAVGVLLGAVQVMAPFFFLPDERKLVGLAALPTLLYGFKIRRRTQAGNTEYQKWLAFKRFLVDYSQLAERDPLAVHLWEQYLVYAISLGVAKKVIAISHIELRDPTEANYRLHSVIYHHPTYFEDFDHLSSSFDRTVSTARSASSRGSGGGFSSGGGGGGGGGGRGAF